MANLIEKAKEGVYVCDWFIFEPLKPSDFITFGLAFLNIIIMTINVIIAGIVGFLIWNATRAQAHATKETNKLASMLKEVEDRNQLSQAFSNFNIILRGLMLYGKWLGEFRKNPNSKYVFFPIDRPHFKIYDVLEFQEAAYVHSIIVGINDMVLIYEKGQVEEIPKGEQDLELYITEMLPKIDRTELLIKKAIDQVVKRLK